MRKLALRWVINAVAVYAAIALIDGIWAGGGWGVYFIVAVLLGLVNAIIAPLFKMLTCPLIILSLGLFTLIVNGLMLWLTGSFARALGVGFQVDGFGPAFWGALVISVVSFGLSVLTGVNKDDDDR